MLVYVGPLSAVHLPCSCPYVTPSVCTLFAYHSMAFFHLLSLFLILSVCLPCLPLALSLQVAHQGVSFTSKLCLRQTWQVRARREAKVKPGRGPHVRIGLLANFTPSLGTRFSSSLSEGGDGIRLGVGLGSPGPQASPPSTSFLYRCSWASPTVSCRGFRGSPEPMGQTMLWQRRA